MQHSQPIKDYNPVHMKNYKWTKDNRHVTEKLTRMVKHKTIFNLSSIVRLQL